MRVNTLVTLGASAAFGILAIVLARGWIEGAVENEFSNKRVTAPITATGSIIETTPIVVADIPLNFGDVLSYENLRLVDMPEGMIPEGAYLSIEDLLFDTTQQTVALSRMNYNEAVLGFKISGPGGRGSLSALISEGKRATAIRVTDVAGVAGFVLPGDSVDIIYTRDAQTRRGADERLVSDVLLQNVKVLGIDQNNNSQSATPSVVDTVTVEVTNEDAQKLHLAMDEGNLSLTLRRVGELNVEKQRRITSDNLINRHKPKSQKWRKPVAAAKLTPPKPTDQVANITIIRGDDRDEVSVAMEETSLPAADVQLSNELAGG